MTKIKSLFFIAVSCLIFLIACKQPKPNSVTDKVFVSGYIKGGNDSVALLERLGGQTIDLIATVPFTADSFTFFNQLEKGVGYQIRVGTLLIPFVYEGDPIHFYSESADLNCMKIEGAPATVGLIAFLDKFDMINGQIGLHKSILDTLAGKSSNDTLYLQVKRHVEEKEIELNRLIKNYVDTAKYFPLVFYTIGLLNPTAEVAYFDSFAQKITKRFPNDPFVDTFKQLILTAIHSNKTGGMEVGAMIQDFSLNDLSGQVFHFSSTRGKYVLLDFWASNCSPCQAYNQEKILLNQKFKDQSFSIVSISLDQNVGKWKSQIEKNKLQWIQLIEPKAWDSKLVETFGIEKMPYNYLIDPNGKIVAKNLSIAEVEQKLNEVFSIPINTPISSNK